MVIYLYTSCSECNGVTYVQDMGLLKDYIGYARSYVHPKISEKAGQSLIEAYVDMRKVGSGRGQVSAYPRQLESLIRLSEAHARMRLSDVVEVKDVDEARRFVVTVTAKIVKTSWLMICS